MIYVHYLDVDGYATIAGAFNSSIDAEIWAEENVLEGDWDIKDTNEVNRVYL